MVLTVKQQRARLARMVSADTNPVLENDDLDLLLAMHATVDSAGLLPSDVNWTPTYHMMKAAYEGWLWKAGRVADLSSVRTGDMTFEDGMIFEHCTNMAERYRRRIVGSIPITGIYTRGGDTAIVEEDE